MPRATEEKPRDRIRYLEMDIGPVRGENVDYFYELTGNALPFDFIIEIRTEIVILLHIGRVRLLV